MADARIRPRHTLPLIVAAALMAMAPTNAAAGPQQARAQAQPPASQGTVVVERVENGPAFGVEFKYAQVNNEDALMLGGYAGAIFDNKLLIGAAGYWQVDSYDDGYAYYGDNYYGYDDCCGYDSHYGWNGYGGLLLEWYALRTRTIAFSARGLVGGGIATVGWDGYAEYPQPLGRHGGAYPPHGGYYYGAYDQGYFIFEPQANVTVRVAPGMAIVGGVGYRVIGWANGFEDQLQGVTATFAIRFGGGK